MKSDEEEQLMLLPPGDPHQGARTKTESMMACKRIWGDVWNGEDDPAKFGEQRIHEEVRWLHVSQLNHQDLNPPPGKTNMVPLGVSETLAVAMGPVKNRPIGVESHLEWAERMAILMRSALHHPEFLQHLRRAKEYTRVYRAAQTHYDNLVVPAENEWWEAHPDENRSDSIQGIPVNPVAFIHPRKLDPCPVIGPLVGMGTQDNPYRPVNQSGEPIPELTVPESKHVPIWTLSVKGINGQPTWRKCKLRVPEQACFKLRANQLLVAHGGVATVYRLPSGRKETCLTLHWSPSEVGYRVVDADFNSDAVVLLLNTGLVLNLAWPKKKDDSTGAVLISRDKTRYFNAVCLDDLHPTRAWVGGSTGIVYPLETSGVPGSADVLFFPSATKIRGMRSIHNTLLLCDAASFVWFNTVEGDRGMVGTGGALGMTRAGGLIFCAELDRGVRVSHIEQDDQLALWADLSPPKELVIDLEHSPPMHLAAERKRLIIFYPDCRVRVISLK